MEFLQLIDTHTGGEPTRVVVDGFPDLGDGTLAEKREVFRSKFDRYRSAIIDEPRGSDVMVGALLCEPTDPSCAARVIFFNNVGMLNMCGHGTIGTVVALAHLGRLGVGRHKLETPVGIVRVHYLGGARVEFENIPAYRFKQDVVVDVPQKGPVRGDIAWGGNWFFLVDNHREAIIPANIPGLTEIALAIRENLHRQQITGADGAEIDHIELHGPPLDPRNDSRNFVLCPGRAFDRSPCGTGTSARVACLYAQGRLAPGATCRQESIVGSVFEASCRIGPDGEILPKITGSAYVTGEIRLILDPDDPFCWGLRVPAATPV